MFRKYVERVCVTSIRSWITQVCRKKDKYYTHKNTSITHIKIHKYVWGLLFASTHLKNHKYVYCVSQVCWTCTYHKYKFMNNTSMVNYCHKYASKITSMLIMFHKYVERILNSILTQVSLLMYTSTDLKVTSIIFSHVS